MTDKTDALNDLAEELETLEGTSLSDAWELLDPDSITASYLLNAQAAINQAIEDVRCAAVNSETED